MQQRALLLQVGLCCGLVLGGRPILPDAHAPLLPAPQACSNGSTTLRLDPEAFQFRYGGSSAVLQAAMSRYRAIMFAWGPESGGGPLSGLGRLESLEIRVDDHEDSSSSLQLHMDERYQLQVGVNGSALIQAPTVWGALRALESFSQLVEWQEAGVYTLAYAPWQITDEPAHTHRGVMIDTARHFLPVGTIKRQIDALSFNKMNVLHWHAVDADSFPMQSTTFPGLSRLGSYNPRSAVYSPEDVRGVVEYARMRGVRVVPEFDVPGHCSSWSLDPAHRELFIPCGQGPAGDFHGATFVLDIGNPRSLSEFLLPLLAELLGRFPDNAAHLGGDEVDLSCLNKSAGVQAWINARGGAARNVTARTALVDWWQRVGRALRELRKTSLLTTWADTFIAAQQEGDPAVLYAGPSVFQVWGQTPPVEQVVRSSPGFSVVQSKGYYLSSGNPATGGSPVVWESIYNTDIIPQNLTAGQASRVLGAEACMWGEVTDQFNIDSKLWFRASVLAERLWTSNATIAARAAQSGDGWPATYESVDVTARLIKQRCRMLQRGIRPTPYSTQQLPDRDRWAQCELWLPDSQQQCP